MKKKVEQEPELLVFPGCDDQEKLQKYGTDWIPKVPGLNKVHPSSAFRRKLHIRSYTGPNGKGKTMCAVYDLLPTLAGIKWECSNPAHLHTQRGQTSGYRRVLSSVKIIDPRTGGAHPLWDPYDDHRRLLAAEHCDILADEITGLASSRESASMPVQVQNMLTQLRRRDDTFSWTTPNWARADAIIREVTVGVTYCKAYLPLPQPGRIWASNSLFVWDTYDALNFEQFNTSTRERIVPNTFQWKFRHKLEAQNFYDSSAAVLVAKSTTESGTCMHCAGKRTPPKCVCDRDMDQEEALQRIAEEWAKAQAETASTSAHGILPDLSADALEPLALAEEH